MAAKLPDTPADWSQPLTCRDTAGVWARRPHDRTQLYAVATAVVNKRAGGMGLISGRKAFQRPMKEGVALLNAIQDVYLDPEVTIA